MTDAESAAFFRTEYAEARAVFPLLPQFCDITNNPAGTISTEELNAAGLPVFNIPPGYVPMSRACKHECGHAYLRLLE